MAELKITAKVREGNFLPPQSTHCVTIYFSDACALVDSVSYDSLLILDWPIFCCFPK